MSLPAPFLWKLHPESKPTFTPNVLSIQLGNNLSQDEALGPNNIATDWDVVVMTKNQEDMRAVCSYLAALKGAAPFPWTQPAPFDADGQLLWVCKGPWNPTYLGGLVMKLNTRFTRYFGPTP